MADRRFDIVAFDVDGTLVEGPDGFTVWEVLNERFTGCPEHNDERMAEYRAGRLSYADWVALDVGGWQRAGATRDDLVAAMAPLRLVAGAREATERLTAAGCRLIVVSGTLDLLLETLWPDHPFAEVHANHVGFDDAGRISHWRATPFDMDGKARLLRAIAMRDGVPLSRCAFVGDSANDAWIAREAGFSIAFRPTSAEIADAADVVIRDGDLRDVAAALL